VPAKQTDIFLPCVQVKDPDGHFDGGAIEVDTFFQKIEGFIKNFPPFKPSLSFWLSEHLGPKERPVSYIGWG
jgi:hypothetical protein